MGWRLVIEVRLVKTADVIALEEENARLRRNTQVSVRSICGSKIFSASMAFLRGGRASLPCSLSPLAG